MINRKGLAGILATTALMGGGIAVPTTPARAQALQPAVDVCTGITLPRSAITEVIGAVNQPIVDQIETTVNGITTVTLILAPLATLPDLDIDLTTILADAAAGDDISLQILDTDGNVIGASDDCNLTADNFTLDEQGGIEIGGNRVSGLGADGQAASAAELDAIALGNNATTTAGATGAVAIGTGASATAADSVAIGSGSLAARGAQSGYSAPGISGTSDSIGSVSVGTVGGERQITNVAPGTADTDAATVGQVTGAVAAATDNLVGYDGAAQTSVTLAGAGGTTISNLAPGTLDATSSDAVNGSQLFATNQNVSGNTDAIAALDTRVIAVEGDVIGLDTRVTTNEGAITTLDGRVTANEADIATLGTQVATNTAGIAALDTQVTTNTADIAALDGRVSVNELGIATNAADIADLQASVGDVQATVSVFDGRITQNETDIVNLDARVTNTEGDIVNLDGRVTLVEGDVAGLDTRVTTNEGSIANLDTRVTTNAGEIADLGTRVTLAEDDIDGLDTRVTANESDIADHDVRIAINTDGILDLDARVTVNEGDIAELETRVDNVPVKYMMADGITPSPVPTAMAAFVGTGGGQVTVGNVAAGTLSATSSEAVNGSQLFATNQAVAQNRADIDQNTADITTITNNLAGSTVVAVQYSDPDNPNVSNGGTITNDVALVGADASAPVALHNVANGVAATDAVNLGQLQSGLETAMAASMGYTDQRVADAMAYTDMRVAEIGFDLADLRDDAFAGTAAAMAMGSIPQTIEAGRSMISGGVGHFRGETAFGVGYSAAFGDGQGVIKLSGTIDTRGNGGVAAGAGFAF